MADEEEKKNEAPEPSQQSEELNPVETSNTDDENTEESYGDGAEHLTGEVADEKKLTANPGGGSAIQDYSSKYPKVENGDDFMKQAWNELLALYEYLLSKMVDFSLNFTSYVLLEPFRGGSEKVETIKAVGAMVAANKAYKEKLDELALKRDSFNAAHIEIMDNIKKQKEGKEPEWKVWQKEPECFKDMVELSKKAEANPNSPEAKQWETLKKAPEIMETVRGNEGKIAQFACVMAGYEEEAKLNEYSKEDKKQDKMNVRVKERSKELQEKIQENIEKIREKAPKKVTEYVKFLNEEITKVSDKRTLLAQGQIKPEDRNNAVTGLINSIDEFKIGDKKVGELEKPKTSKKHSFEIYLNNESNSTATDQLNKVFEKMLERKSR